MTVVRVHRETRKNGERSFSPWQCWHPEKEVYFHDRIAIGIRNKTLSVDKIAVIVLQLLTSADELALALLEEIQYIDSPFAHEVNAESLMTAQNRISEACKFLRSGGKSSTPGDVLLSMYAGIIHRCHIAMLSLNNFYDKLDMWLYVCDEKCFHASRALVLVINAIDAAQQCRAMESPSEYVAYYETELEAALARANQALRIVVNALNAVRVPAEDSKKVFTEKSALLTNASILIATLKLLDIAARQAFSVNAQPSQNVRDRIKEIKHCCSFRVAMLRAKVAEYKDTSRPNTVNCIGLSLAIWALDRLYDEVDTVARGTYICMGKDLRYTDQLYANVAECLTAITLLHLAYRHTKHKNLPIAKFLKHNCRIMQYSRMLCVQLESRVVYGELNATDLKKLYDVFARLELVCANLQSIDKSKLLYTQWSAGLLEQAIKAVSMACDTCASELKNIELSTKARDSSDSSYGNTRTVGDSPLRSVCQERYNAPSMRFSHNDIGMALNGRERGGGGYVYRIL